MPVVKQQKRVPGVAQHHVERVHVFDAHMGEQVALIAPVDLGLRARHHLEPAVQTPQRVVISAGMINSAPEAG
jgi:hypothetical protein